MMRNLLGFGVLGVMLVIMAAALVFPQTRHNLFPLAILIVVVVVFILPRLIRRGGPPRE